MVNHTLEILRKSVRLFFTSMHDRVKHLLVNNSDKKIAEKFYQYSEASVKPCQLSAMERFCENS